MCGTPKDGVGQENWESMYNTLREAAKNVGTKKIREYTSSLRMVNVKRKAGDTCFDENMKGQVTNRTPKRKDLGEVFAALPGDVLQKV